MLPDYLDNYCNIKENVHRDDIKDRRLPVIQDEYGSFNIFELRYAQMCYIKVIICVLLYNCIIIHMITLNTSLVCVVYVFRRNPQTESYCFMEPW